VDDRRVGRLIRAARHRHGWRQVDVEAACGVDQTSVSLIERGHLRSFTLDTLTRVAEAVGVRLELQPRLTAAEVACLLDAGHARLVEQVVALLQRAGWEVHVEFTFSHDGERGSVDVLAWRAATRTLLIVEVKTRLLDVQELLATLDRKCRLVPRLISSEGPWRPVSVGRLLVVEESSVARRIVTAHAATFGVALPARSRSVRVWITAPAGDLAGLWFVSGTNGGRTDRRRPGRRGGA
jgi:transcriptional regulator with XRE-family HTH domain